MTELAHAISQFPRTQDTFIHRNLPLPETDPYQTAYTVYAKAAPPGAGARVGFALSANATQWYTRGIHWGFLRAEAEYSLFVQFVLLDGIARFDYPLRADLRTPWLATPVPATPNSPATQTCCAPTGFSQLEYHVRAVLTDGTSVDPIIIVTPINNNAADDDEQTAGKPENGHRPRSLLTLDELPGPTCHVPPENELLQLHDGGAFNIIVKISNDGPEFSVPQDPTEVPGGVHWFASKEFPSVTLTFLFPIDQIQKLESTTPELRFTEVAIIGTQGFQSTRLTASLQTDYYCFDILSPTNDRLLVHRKYDPIIIVTPINNVNGG